MMMQKERKPLNPFFGIAVFVLTILLLVFVAFPLQRALKMPGLALTELIILVLAILPVLLFRQNFKQVFPFRKPKKREVFGTLLLWLGEFMPSVLLALISLYLIPRPMNGSTLNLYSFLASVPFAVAFFIMAVMPAICEEALFRGLILSTFRRVPSKWAIILIMGLIFGIFHLDRFRFLNTAFLGALLTYLMIETENLLLPILLHFVHNSLSVFSLQLQDLFAAATVAPTDSNPFLAGIAVCLVLGCGSPFCIYLGGRLVRRGRVEPTVTDISFAETDLNSASVSLKVAQPNYEAAQLSYEAARPGYEAALSSFETEQLSYEDAQLNNEDAQSSYEDTQPRFDPQAPLINREKSSSVPIAICVILTVLMFYGGIALFVMQVLSNYSHS